MSILTRYLVQCTPCERYLGCSRPAITNSSDTPTFLDFSSAYDEAVRRGWSAYPLICPDCAADLARRVKEGSDAEVRRDGDAPEDGGRLPEGGQSPE